MLINFAELAAEARYHWMTQAVIPRPVAWALTATTPPAAGALPPPAGLNLAPFSYFNALASAPPLLGFSVGLRPPGQTKDTLRNIRAFPFVTIHVANMAQLPALNESAASLPPTESEVAKLCLPLAKFAEGYPLPRLAQAPIAFACKLWKEISLGEAQTLIVAEILHLYADNKTLQKDDKGRAKIAADAVCPVARLAAGEYATLSKITKLRRPL